MLLLPPMVDDNDVGEVKNWASSIWHYAINNEQKKCFQDKVGQFCDWMAGKAMNDWIFYRRNAGNFHNPQ